METKIIPVKRTRVLADGTKKSYMTKAAYKVKNGIGDQRVNNGSKEKLTPAQKEEIWTRFCAGVTIKRICADIGISYIPAKRCIDKKKEQLTAMPNAPAVPVEKPPAHAVITDDDIAAFDKLLNDI
jgi:hypothetical protein